MRFVYPEVLWLLVVMAPLFAGFLWWAWRRKQSLIAQFVRSKHLAELTVGVSRGRQQVKMAMLVLALVFLLLALARPQWGFTWEEAHQRGLDIAIAMDTSRSLLAEDIPPNRFERAKLAAWELVQLARMDRYALVPFAGTAFIQAPLTLDEDAFRQSLDAIEVGIIPQEGSALAAAIRTASGAFTEEDDNFKVIVLFTDGEDHLGGAVEAAKQAAARDIRIFTIGVGTPEGELLRVPQSDGSLAFLKDRSGAVVKSRLNESLLREIADAGNGFYLPIRGANTMETLYERGLEVLPRAEFSARIVQRYHERFYWPLMAALLLLAGEIFVSDRRRPSRESSSPEGSGRFFRVVLFVALAGFPVTASASPGSAARDYAAGKFRDALDEYSRLLEESPDDPRLHYNAGAAAYRLEDYENAIRHFRAALKTDDFQLEHKARYGLGNALYYLGESALQPAQKIEPWTEALNQYEGAIQLDPNDEDARYNHEVVEAKLKQLQQEQEEKQKQDSQSQDESRESEDNQSEQEQRSGESPEDDSENQSSSEQSSERSGEEEDQSASSDESRQSEPRDSGSEENREATQSQSGSEGEESRGEERKAEEGSIPPPIAGQMSEQQARQLLDALRMNEAALLFAPTNQPARGRSRSTKEW